MIGIEAATRRVVSDLAEIGLGHALIGGVAVSALTEPRFTKDLDMVMAVADDAAAEAAVYELSRCGYDIRATVEHDSGRLATVRTVVPEFTVAVDLLFASSGIEAEIVRDAQTIEVFPAVLVPVARAGHLIAIKLLARDDDLRPQDITDVRKLLEVATGSEVQRAREAVTLITARGYHRGRDLAAALDELIG